KMADGFCLDPQGGVKTFGDAAALPIEKICDVFDGECEIYKSFVIRRLVEVRYVDGSGSPATIDVHLSKFASTEGAYAMFTKRVVGDGDPADPAPAGPPPRGGAGAGGRGPPPSGRAFSPAKTPSTDGAPAGAAIKPPSKTPPPPLVRAIGDRLPGETAPPGAAALPKEDL